MTIYSVFFTILAHSEEEEERVGVKGIRPRVLFAERNGSSILNLTLFILFFFSLLFSTVSFSFLSFFRETKKEKKMKRKKTNSHISPS